ncbi:MAG: hypothetical protein VKQ33_12325 [Candidatus Sericytochromatia bacterium]|nr:hypothetical protein [Candidatus Sericytochromatia bacterium]
MARRAREVTALVVAAAALVGCPSREFYRVPAEPDWTALGEERLQVPAFKAATSGWTLAEAARARVTEALMRAALPVTTASSRVRLVGRLEDLRVSSTASAPRRVLRAGTNVSGGGANVEAHVWEQELEHRLRLRLALRLEKDGAGILWQRSSEGQALQSSVEVLNWPGSDPLPPPPGPTAPAPPVAIETLGREALTQALGPLLAALTDRYGYRVVP